MHKGMVEKKCGSNKQGCHSLWVGGKMRHEDKGKVLEA